MPRGTHTIFHIADEDRTIDIDAASLSEARRKFKEKMGYFPEKDAEIETEEI